MQKVLSLPASQSVGQGDKRTTEGAKSRSKDEKIYRVQLGDTLSAIAEREAVNLKDLIDVNHFKSPDRLAVGQKIIIPTSTELAERQGERIASENFRQTASPLSPIATEQLSVVAMATLGTLRERNYPTVSQLSTNRWLQQYGKGQAIA